MCILVTYEYCTCTSVDIFYMEYTILYVGIIGIVGVYDVVWCYISANIKLCDNEGQPVRVWLLPHSVNVVVWCCTMQ